MKINLWRWHPEVALRYLPIVKLINSLEEKDSTILEIGSGSLGITPYLGREVTGIDLNFAGPQTSLLTKINASATSLPLKDKSFDIVILVDLLEHIPVIDRYRVLSEAVRVTNKMLLIVVPCGPLAQKEDIYLAKYYKKVYGKSFLFFEQHLQYGLPSVELVNSYLKKATSVYHRKMEVKIKGITNMKLHRFLMKGWITKNFIIDFAFRKLMVLFIPIMTKVNKIPTYRSFFVINFLK